MIESVTGRRTDVPEAFLRAFPASSPATRTATAVGSIRSVANVEQSLRVNLWMVLFDEDGVLAFGYPRSVDSATVVLGEGEQSGTITLIGSAYLMGGWEMQGWCTLDRLSPSPADAIDSTGRTTYVEAVVLGGELVGFGPGISAMADELLAEIPGLDRLLVGIPGVDRVT